MTHWRLETSPQFEKAARKLDQRVLRRVKVYLDEVCDLEDARARGKGLAGELAGELAGYWRYRIGDYRIVVVICDHSLIIVAITIGHRSDVS